MPKPSIKKGKLTPVQQDERRRAVIDMFERGFSMQEIAEIFQVSKSSIQRVLNTEYLIR
jgi:transposase